MLFLLLACAEPTTSDDPIPELGDTDTDTDTDSDSDADSDTDTDTDSDTDGDTPVDCALRAYPSSVDFGETELGHSVSAAMVITNEGLATCTISDITLDESNDLSMTTISDFSLAYEESGRWTLTFLPQNAEEIDDTMHVLSDDPARPDLIIPVSGSCPG